MHTHWGDLEQKSGGKSIDTIEGSKDWIPMNYDILRVIWRMFKNVLTSHLRNCSRHVYRVHRREVQRSYLSDHSARGDKDFYCNTCFCNGVGLSRCSVDYSVGCTIWPWIIYTTNRIGIEEVGYSYWHISFTQILTIGGHLRKSIKPMKRGTHATGNRFFSNLSDLEFPCTLHRCCGYSVYVCRSFIVNHIVLVSGNYMRYFVVCNFACNCSVFVTSDNTLKLCTSSK